MFLIYDYNLSIYFGYILRPQSALLFKRAFATYMDTSLEIGECGDSWYYFVIECCIPFYSGMTATSCSHQQVLITVSLYFSKLNKYISISYQIWWITIVYFICYFSGISCSSSCFIFLFFPSDLLRHLSYLVAYFFFSHNSSLLLVVLPSLLLQ